MPSDWQGVRQVSVAKLTGTGPERRGEVPVVAGKVTLDVGKDEAFKISVAS